MEIQAGGTNLDAVARKTTGYAEPLCVSDAAALGFVPVPVHNTAIPEGNSARAAFLQQDIQPCIYGTANIPRSIRFLTGTCAHTYKL